MRLPDSVYKQAAEETGHSFALVKKINNFYWKYGIKENLSKANHPSLLIKNIGTIVISKYKLDKEIWSIIRKIKKTKYSKFYTPIKKMTIIIGYKVNLKRLWNIKQKLINDSSYTHGKSYRVCKNDKAGD